MSLATVDAAVGFSMALFISALVVGEALERLAGQPNLN